MSSLYKFKIVMGGSDPEKIPFFENPEFNGKDFSHIGITINPIECVTDFGDSYLFIFWHLNQKQRFEFMLSSFCHGAGGGIICIDRSNFASYREANNWIKTFKNQSKNIPLIIFSFQSKISHKEISRKQVRKLVEEYNLEGLFVISSDEQINHLLKKDFFRFIIQIFNGSNINESEFSIMIPTEEKDFIEFSKSYSICPICKTKNHIENLKEFYFSKKDDIMLLRDKFFDLMDKSAYLEERWSNSLNLGILCCSCYKKYFSGSSSK